MSEELSSGQKTPTHILVVDDEEGVRALLDDYLSARGYKVKTVQNSEEALALIDEVDFDLVLVDLVMPGIDGYDLCDRLRNYHRTEDVPIIVVSGRSDWENDIRDAFDAGANDYIIKTELDTLPEKIERCLLIARNNRAES